MDLLCSHLSRNVFSNRYRILVPVGLYFFINLGCYISVSLCLHSVIVANQFIAEIKVLFDYVPLFFLRFEVLEALRVKYTVL